MSERMAVFPEEWLRKGNDWDSRLVFPTWTVCFPSCPSLPSSFAFASFPTGPRVVFLCRKEGVCVCPRICEEENVADEVQKVLK